MYPRPWTRLWYNLKAFEAKAHHYSIKKLSNDVISIKMLEAFSQEPLWSCKVTKSGQVSKSFHNDTCPYPIKKYVSKYLAEK